MLNGGQRDGARILSRSTVGLMTADHLGPAINTTVNPGMLLLGSQGYTLRAGLPGAARDGIAGVHGTAGEFMWAGYAGTFFWAEPKEQICAVYMTQAPSPVRAYYRRAMKGPGVAGAGGLRARPAVVGSRRPSMVSGRCRQHCRSPLRQPSAALRRVCTASS